MSEEAIEKTFVELVLERMDTNPEEFIEGHTHFRWSTLVNVLLHRAAIGEAASTPTYRSGGETLLVWALTTAELDLLQAKYRNLYRAFLRREFVKNLLSGEGFAYKLAEQQPLADRYVIKGGVTTATNTITSHVYRPEEKSRV